MRFARRRLSCLTAIWIGLQLVARLGAPVTLHASAPGADMVRCLCAADHEGRECPMHKHGDGHHEQASDCAMRGTAPSPEALLLTGIVSALVPRFEMWRHAFATPADIDPRLQSSSRFVPPDAPPPRR